MADEQNGGAAAAGETQAPAGGGAVQIDGLSGEDVAMLQGKGWVKDGKPDLAGIVSGYRNAEKAIGGDKIVLPGKDAKPEEWNKVWEKLGRPANADAYEVKKPDGATWYSDGLAGVLRKAAFDAGLPARQFGAVHDAFVGAVQAAMIERRTAAEGQLKALETEMGPAFKANVQMARSAAAKAMEAAGISGTDFDALGDAIGHDKVIKLFHHFGQAMAEDRAVEGHKPTAEGSEAAKAEWTALQQTDRYKQAINNPQHPEHKTVLAEKRKLFDRMYGTAPAGGVTSVQL